MAQGTSFEGFGFGLQQTGSAGSHLLIAAQQGDIAAFQELVRSYDATVMRVVLGLTGCEDSAQELYCNVFRDAFRSIRKLDSRSSVFVWLYRILVKQCIAYCRRNQVASADQSQHHANLAAVLCSLPPSERVIFLLKHSQRLRVQTLAEIFSCPQDHIVEALQKAAQRLRAGRRLELTSPDSRQTAPETAASAP